MILLNKDFSMSHNFFNIFHFSKKCLIFMISFHVYYISLENKLTTYTYMHWYFNLFFGITFSITSSLKSSNWRLFNLSIIGSNSSNKVQKFGYVLLKGPLLNVLHFPRELKKNESSYQQFHVLIFGSSVETN